MTEAPFSGPCILRRRQLEARTGLSRTAIYDRLDPKSPRYDPTFPRRVHLGAGTVGWVEQEVDAWITTRVAQRDSA